MPSPMLAHVAYRTETPHPSVARAWGMHQDKVVMSFWLTPQDPDVPDGEREEPTIATAGKDRTQEALDRAHARFGNPDAPAFPTDAMLAAGRRRA